MTRYYLFMALSVFLASVSQILLKKSANQSYDSFLKEYLNPLVIVGYTMMIGATVTTIIAYQGIQYKEGPIIESFSYILVMFFSVLFLNERVTKKKIIGYLLILAGIAVFYI